MLIPIIWSGRGPLAAVCVIVGIVAAIGIEFAIADSLAPPGPPPAWPFAVGFLLAALLNLPLGLWLNRRAARTVTDPRTGAAVVGRSPHTLWGLPMQWWSVAMLLLAGLMVLGEVSDRAERAAATQPAVLRKN